MKKENETPKKNIESLHECTGVCLPSSARVSESLTPAIKSFIAEIETLNSLPSSAQDTEWSTRLTTVSDLYASNSAKMLEEEGGADVTVLLENVVEKMTEEGDVIWALNKFKEIVQWVVGCLPKEEEMEEI